MSGNICGVAEVPEGYPRRWVASHSSLAKVLRKVDLWHYKSTYFHASL